MSLLSRREALYRMGSLAAVLASKSVAAGNLSGEEQSRMAEQTTLTTDRVTTEDDKIYYEYRGHGRPLLMIAGGLGDAGVYTFVADILADEFKVITYDRRG
jgi:hypothetical protein